MEGKKSAMIVILVVVIVIVATIAYFFILNDASVEGITAMEARDIAERHALQWDSTAELGHVSAFENDTSIGLLNLSNDGICSQWRFHYVSSTTITNYSRLYYKALIVTVVDGAAFIEEEYMIDVNTYSASNDSIQEWNIDSPEATTIAQSNATAVQWLSESDYRLVKLKLIKDPRYQNPFWIITWLRPYTGESFRVNIDGVTGEITEVSTGL